MPSLFPSHKSTASKKLRASIIFYPKLLLSWLKVMQDNLYNCRIPIKLGAVVARGFPTGPSLPIPGLGTIELLVVYGINANVSIFTLSWHGWLNIVKSPVTIGCFIRIAEGTKDFHWVDQVSLHNKQFGGLKKSFSMKLFSAVNSFNKDRRMQE